jgi:hypothetical protein
MRVCFRFARLAPRANHPDIFHIAWAKHVVVGATWLARAVQVQSTVGPAIHAAWEFSRGEL